jgi:signal transduction histidine kinase
MFNLNIFSSSFHHLFLGGVLLSLFLIQCSKDSVNTQLVIDNEESVIETGLSQVIQHITKAELVDAEQLLDSLESVAIETSNQQAIARINIQRGLLLAYQGQFNQGIGLLEKSLPIAQEFGKPNLVFLYHVRLSALYENIGNIEKALEYIDKATNTPSESLTAEEIFGSLVTKASIYSKNQQFAESILLSQQAIKMAETNEISSVNLAVAHNNLGLLLHRLRRFEEAIKEYESSFRINTESNNILGLSQNLNNMANTYESLGNHDKSIELLLQAVELNKTGNANAPLIRNYYNLGDSYFNSGRTDQAEEYYQLAYDMSKKAGFENGIMYNANGLARVKLDRGLYREAIQLANESNLLAETSKTLEILVTTSQTLSNSYEILGDFSNALKFHKVYHSVSDTLTSNRTKREILEVRSSYNLELLTNENELLEQQLIVYELQVRRQILYLIMLIIVIISTTIILYVITKNKKKIDSKNKQLEILNSEKDILTNVIVHDLRNPLMGLQGSLELLNEDPTLNTQQAELSKIALNSSQKISEMVDGLLEVSKMKDEHIDHELVAIEPHILCEDAIDTYQPKARLKGIELTGNYEKFKIVTYPDYISRILGNLISNALKFSENGTSICVECLLDASTEKWTLKVTDSGPGFTKYDKENAFKMFQRLSAAPINGEESTGLGLYTVNMLTQKLGGYVSILDNTPRGSIIVCEFPTEISEFRL